MRRWNYVFVALPSPPTSPPGAFGELKLLGFLSRALVGGKRRRGKLIKLIVTRKRGTLFDGVSSNKMNFTNFPILNHTIQPFIAFLFFVRFVSLYKMVPKIRHMYVTFEYLLAGSDTWERREQRLINEKTNARGHPLFFSLIQICEAKLHYTYLISIEWPTKISVKTNS